MTTVPGVAGHWDQSMSDGSAAPKISDYTANQWTQKLTLTPAEQQALESQQAIQQKQSTLALGLQDQVQKTMAGGFTAPTMEQYMSGVGKTNQNFGGFTPYGVGDTDQSQINAGSFTRGAMPLQQGLRSSAQRLDLNAPQFSDANAQQGAQAAYDSSHSLIADQQQQDTTHLDNQLRLQGLQPGSEAYNNAYQNLQRTQAQQNNNLASQATLTGNQMANANYASSLAGYGAKNAAYGQQYGQDANTMTTNNAARSQTLTNGLSQYQAALQGQTAYNTAQNQAYTQTLAAYGANQSAQQASNAAQQQAYNQGLGSYGTAYQSALQNYLQPLNNMQAVLGGNQVAMPNMPGFAASGVTKGADMSGATAAQGSWNQGIYNSDVASANSTNAAGAGAIAAIAAAFI
jgi:hypothetical protein